MRTPLLAAALAVTLTACSERAASSEADTRRVASTATPSLVCSKLDAQKDAVLTQLQHVFPDDIDGLSTWIARYHNQPDIDYAKRKIASLRTWSLALNDPCLRVAYAYWLDYYADQCTEGEREMATHEIGREQAQYDADLDMAAMRRATIRPLPTLPGGGGRR